MTEVTRLLPFLSSYPRLPSDPPTISAHSDDSSRSDASTDSGSEEHQHDTHATTSSLPLSPPTVTTAASSASRSSATAYSTPAQTPRSSVDNGMNSPNRRSECGSEANNTSNPHTTTNVSCVYTPPPSATSSPHHSEYHIPSPFSFFAHASTTTGEHSGAHASGRTFQIELAERDIIVMEGRTSKLEGILYLNLHKNTKVKSLKLEFTGKTSVTWVDDNSYAPATKNDSAPHIEHTWSLIPQLSKTSYTVLAAGQHAYPFCLDLPGTLPETLTGLHGKVRYNITATLTKPGLTFTTSTTSEPVNLLRQYSTSTPRSRRHYDGGMVTHAAGDTIHYRIVLPQARVPQDVKIPIQVMITSPNRSTTFIDVLQVGLWEKISYRSEGRRRDDQRVIKVQKCEGWSVHDTDPAHSEDPFTWNKVLLFDMPHLGRGFGECNPCSDNEILKVTHFFRFTILAAEGSKRTRIAREMEVRVLAFEDEYQPVEGSEMEFEDDLLNELPSYLTSFSTPRMPYDAEQEMMMMDVNGDNEDDDLLRALTSNVHLPTYAESEDSTASAGNSRNVSQAPSRNVSPERNITVYSRERTERDRTTLNYYYP